MSRQFFTKNLKHSLFAGTHRRAAVYTAGHTAFRIMKPVGAQHQPAGQFIRLRHASRLTVKCAVRKQLCQSAQAALSLTVGKGKLHQQRQQASKCTVSFPRRGGMSTLAFRTDHNAPIFSSHLKAIPVCSSIAEAALAISSVEIPSTTASALPGTALPTVPPSILRMQGSTVFSSHVPE